MKDIIKTQIKHQQEIFVKQKSSEKGNSVCSVKLPKLDLLSFYGDKIKWVEFWDSFESSVHKNPKLTNIEKFNYLWSKLQGEAKRAVSGLTLSSDNHSLAIKILEERFGNRQDVIDIHYNQLIKIQSPSSKTSSLRDFLDTFNRHIRSLEVLKQDVNQGVFISIIRSKLPEDVLLQLEIQKGAKSKWTIFSLCEKLNDYAVAREKSCVTEKVKDTVIPDTFGKKFDSKPWKNKSFSFKRNENRVSQPTSSAEALIVTTSSTKSQPGVHYFDKCRYCGNKHWSDECQKFQTIEERKGKLKGSCFKCLKAGHSSSECKRNKLCIYCNEVNFHHRSLCPTKFKIKNSSVYLSKEISEYCFENSESVVHNFEKTKCENGKENALLTTGERVMMPTAKSEVRNPNLVLKGQTRILFDSGSQRTYISQRLASKLKLKGYQEEEIKLMTFGSEKAKIVKTSNTKLDIKLKNGKYFSVVANIVPVISGSLNRRTLDSVSMSRLKQVMKDIYLADDLPTDNESSGIDLLIGNDYYLDFILDSRIEVQPGLYLLASTLGWIVTGRVKDRENQETETGLLIISHTSVNEFLEHRCIGKKDYEVLAPPDLTDFWKLKSIGITDQTDKTEDEMAMKIFKEILKFEKGRYQVKWPWKKHLPDLPVNRKLAFGRLKSNMDRMRKKSGLLKQYDTILQDQLSKGIIEKVNKDNTEGLLHYIPHHAVVTPLKTTTKVRIVYDASSKASKEVKSLNDCLFRGPVLLQNLCGMLIRFRLYRIAIVADIEKAFLQIGLQSSKRNVTRFLWIKDCENPVTSTDNIQEYRFCRIPFGVISTPFLLGATIDSHLTNYKTSCANKIRNDIYVDNLINGANSVADAINIYSESKEIFKEASMNLREWITNESCVNEFIPEEDKINVNSTKVLGHVWNTEKDTLSVKSSDAVLISKTVTKRTALKRIAELFDPLGLFSPVLIQGKILLQSLWKKKMDWDDELCNVDLQKWNEIKCDLERISTCEVSRKISLDSDSNSVQYRLLCFCDASARAYSAVIYLHQSDGYQSRCDIVFSKSRLAPVKTMAIPRLELLAVVIGVRCLTFVAEGLKLPITKKYLWSDSQCVLKWKSSEKDLSVFVRNRVEEIKKHSDLQFGYIPTDENPADVATRGTNTEKLCNNKLWWHGPFWTENKGDCWKEYISTVSENTEKEFNSEIRRSRKICSSLFSADAIKDSLNEIPGNSPFGIKSENYSSFIKLIRITTWCRRFISRIRKETVCFRKVLTSDELLCAEHIWIKYIQRKHFSDVFRNIATGRGNNLQRQLGIFVRDDGILCCKGRLENADLSEGARTPILLPRTDKITALLIERFHKQLLHSGVSQTLGTIRQTYWIPQGRATVRQVIRHCIVCRRFEGGAYKMPSMASLPKARVSQSLPFSNVGLDYLGPIKVKCAGEAMKRWICLITCMVTRAVHLEMVNDLTTEEFLYAIRRFISTRGTPSNILSDNASQFKLGSNVVQSIWNKMIHNEDIQNFASNSGISWSFIIELSPWMGGFYERLVGLGKRSLGKTLQKKLLTDVQLQTVLKEIEAILNSRPLVYVNDDINSRITLTPSHFLSLNPKVGIPEIDYDMRDPDYNLCESSSNRLLKLWKKGQTLLNSFWKMWREEYLVNLRERMLRKRIWVKINGREKNN